MKPVADSVTVRGRKRLERICISEITKDKN